MREFELWLDESGDFHHDSRKRKKGFQPSLIGGALVEKGVFGQAAVNRILPEDFSHGTEEERSVTLEKFIKIEEKAQEIEKSGRIFRYVVFSNSECIMVLDNNLTYQNIMAEGIVKLISWLKANFAKIHLQILIANRCDTTAEDHETVKKEEYERRLKEKIIMAGLQDSVKESEWEIELASARKNKSLMIADNICNCFLTRETKFKDDAIIREVYENDERTIKFSVLQSSLERQFHGLMAENRVGEAITVACQSDDAEFIARCMRSVKQRIQDMDANEIELQYRLMEALLKYYIDIMHSYERCEKMLKNLLKYWIPVLKEKEEDRGQLAEKMAFHLNFLLLTSYTHSGNVSDTYSLEKKCDQALAALPPGWEWIALEIKYGIRKVSDRINCFDLHRAFEMNEAMIKQCREIKELLSLYREDVKYDELAKALGTQVQIDAFLLRSEKGRYEEAVRRSDEAIAEFVRSEDICRQYNYRVQLETEAECYDRAYEFLCRAYGLEKNAAAGEFREQLGTDRHKLYAYVKLMAEGRANGWEKAGELYAVLQKTKAMQDVTNVEHTHPKELILWKYAMYLTGNQEWNAGFEAYKNAIECCFAVKEITIQVIGLAIEAERYAMALKYGRKEKLQYKKSLQKRYQKLYERELPDSVRTLFGEIDLKEENWEYYYRLSRKVTY